MLTSRAMPGEHHDAWTEELVQFAHLDSLEFSFTGYDGKKHSAWAIYAHPEDSANLRGVYIPIEAAGEGDSCVDDVSRIARAYLLYYERTRSESALERSVRALDFLLYMATPDGDFNNFIDRTGVINRQGVTSKAHLDWWAARAFYAIGSGIRVIGNREPELVVRLQQLFDLTVEKLIAARTQPGVHPDVLPQYRRLGIPPGDLVNHSGSITSLFVLGLLECFKAVPDPRYEELIFAFCSALVKMEERSFSHYPFTGFHFPTLDNLDMVHLYGNRQVQALARAATMMGITPWLESAEREVDIAYPRILTSGMMPFAFSPEPEEYPAIPYAVETVVSNLMEVYRVTGKEKYAIQAGLFAAWFFGDNASNRPICILEKGRCFDGIGSAGINANSGAESVVESLLALGAILGTPAESYMHMKKSDRVIPLGPVLMPAEMTTGTLGSIRWLKRKFTGGTERRVSLLGAPAQVEFAVDNLHTLQYSLYLSYHLKGSDKAGELFVAVNDRKSVVTLLPCRRDNQYRLAFLGNFTFKEGMRITLVVENQAPEQQVSISTLILQPEIQRKGWVSTDNRVTLLVDTRLDEQKLQIPVSATHLLKHLEREVKNESDRIIPCDRWLLVESREIEVKESR